MFSRHHGSDLVKTGTYLCLYSGEFVDVPDPGGALPGSSRTLYLAVSPIVALLVGPIAGLAFVIFLPLAVPLLIVWLVARRLQRRAPAAIDRMSEAVKPATAQAAYAADPASPGPAYQGPGAPVAPSASRWTGSSPTSTSSSPTWKVGQTTGVAGTRELAIVT